MIKTKLSERIRNNKVLMFLYGQEEDFKIGRAFFSKITGFSSEINTLLLVVLGWKTFVNKSVGIISLICLGIFFVYLFGKIYRRSNLLDVDQRANAVRNPVQKIQLDAAELILKKFGKQK